MRNILRKSRDSPFKAYKWKSLYINYGKEQCIELDINGKIAENVDSVKYLGDIFNSKGNNNDFIDLALEQESKKLGSYKHFAKKLHSETMKFK